MQFTVDIKHWQSEINTDKAQEIITALESGQLIYFPALNFSLSADEQALLAMTINPRFAKNISYNPKDKIVRGLAQKQIAGTLQKMLARYHQVTTQFLNRLYPNYQATIYARHTSYRPIAIKGRRMLRSPDVLHSSKHSTHQ